MLRLMLVCFEIPSVSNPSILPRFRAFSSPLDSKVQCCLWVLIVEQVKLAQVILSDIELNPVSGTKIFWEILKKTKLIRLPNEKNIYTMVFMDHLKLIHLGRQAKDLYRQKCSALQSLEGQSDYSWLWIKCWKEDIYF